jgi:phage protein D
MPGQESHAHFAILINGTDVGQDAFKAFTIDRDMFQPDMAKVVLSNQGSLHASHKVGENFEIKVGDNGGVTIFKGEITGMEPNFAGAKDTTITIIAMNKLHRLLRGRKSKTFVDKTDQDILKEILGKYSLSLEWKHETTITYKHVYQHNQTDIEFLRMRAARLGCHIWCVDGTVYVKQPNLGEAQALELHCDKGGEGEAVHWFRPKLDSSGVVKSVTVRGWDPEKKEEIVGKATASGSQLGSKNASSASNALGSEETFTVDQPIWSKQEADAIAKARLLDASLSYITGEAEISGNPDVELGKHVKITVKSDNPDPFSGKYYVMGLRHAHRQGGKGGDGGGFTTTLRLARDGQDG